MIATGSQFNGAAATWTASINADNSEVVDVKVGIGNGFGNLASLTMCTASFNVVTGDVDFGEDGGGTARAFAWIGWIFLIGALVAIGYREYQHKAAVKPSQAPEP